MVMKKIVSILFLFYSFSIFAIDSPLINKSPQTKAPWIIRAYFDNQQQVQSLSKITTIWEVNKSQKFAVVMIKNEGDFNQIQSLGLKIRLDTKLQKKYITENEKLLSPQTNKGGSTIGGFSCYSSVEGTFSRMDDMVTNYPNLAEIIDIGDSWEKSMNAANGFDLKVLKITNQNIVADKPILFITSAIHAREYATAELTSRFAEYLLSQYNTNSDVKWMLDHQEVQLLLHTNPDGRKKAETGLLWRKNTNQAYCSPTSNSRGADLNRNYTFQWQSNSSECSDIFPGASAASEPEVSSLLNYLNIIYDDNRGELLTDPAPNDTSGVFLDIHSFSQLVLWSWGFTANPPAPNSLQLAAFGRKVAFYNAYTPEPITDLTIANGSSIDTIYGELGVASLAFELGTEFFQDCDVFESKVLPDNLQALLYTSRVARTPYIAPLGPDIENLNIVPNYILVNQVPTLKGNANDDRYNQSNGIQIIEPIQKVDVYVNDLPWLHINALSANASDGTYDSTFEGFNLALNTAQLPIGQHLVYTVATDTAGNEGAIYSKFLNVVTPDSVGSLSGHVTNAITGEDIGAASLSIGGSATFSDSLGQYSLLSPPTTADFQVDSTGFVSKTLSDIVVTLQQNNVQNIQLEPYCSLYNDDVESGINGWSADSPWTIVDQQSSSPTHSWTDSPGSNYSNNINTAITSEAINIVGAESLEVNFNHLCITEVGYDFGHVEVNFDNSTWSEIFTCDGETTWQAESVSIDVPLNSLQIQLRYRLTTDTSVIADGWYIDDVNVKVSGAPCRKILNTLIFSNGFE
jgi:carboxypeptidase T